MEKASGLTPVILFGLALVIVGDLTLYAVLHLVKFSLL